VVKIVLNFGTMNPWKEWLGIPRQGIHWRNDYSTGNYQLLDEEITGEWLFCRELPALGV
jgi:hypothetical protein